MSPRRSRRSFAVPFVLTVAFAPACMVQERRPVNPPGPGPTANDMRGDGEGGGETPPPDPRAEGDGVNADKQPPVIIANPPRALPSSVPAGWSWRQEKDGTCWAYPPPPDCPPNAICNPPPAKKIDCPADDGTVEE
jgi:hypothetical protein